MNAPLNVTLRQLRVFIEVFEVSKLRSFSRTGDEIGFKLIDRTTRDVQLTDVGVNLVGTVSRLLADLDEALREVRDLGQQKRGRVIAACLAQFPLVTMILRDDVQSDVLRKVKSGEVDFGVVIGPFPSDDLLGEPVMTDSFCLVARGAARARRRTGLTVRISRKHGRRVRLAFS